MPSVVSILAAAQRAFADVEALLLPAACLGCERALGSAREAEVCCAVCRFRMRPIAPPTCGRCGQPLDRWEMARAAGCSRTEARARQRPVVKDGPSGPARAEPGLQSGSVRCGFCREWPEALAWAASAVWLDDGPATDLAHALKYGGWRVAAAPMAEIVARYCAARLRRAEVLVPVPLGRARQRERGHNQAEELARALGERLGVPVAAGALVRVRETRTQTRLPPAERRRNVAGAFGAGPRRIEGLRVVLVDDVLTTGATLAAAAEAIAASRCVEVGAVTFGRALVPS